MDANFQPRLTGPARTSKIAARARELMVEGGMEAYLDPHSPAWGDSQIALRDKAFLTAQQEIESQFGLPNWSPPNIDDVEIDWSAEPRAGLRLALRERDAALLSRDKAAAVAHRSATRCSELEVGFLV
jgi:hypothetical protein